MSCVLTHEKNARKPLLGRPDEAAAAPLLPNNVPLELPPEYKDYGDLFLRTYIIMYGGNFLILPSFQIGAVRRCYSAFVRCRAFEVLQEYFSVRV